MYKLINTAREISTIKFCHLKTKPKNASRKKLYAYKLSFSQCEARFGLTNLCHEEGDHAELRGDKCLLDRLFLG